MNIKTLMGMSSYFLSTLPKKFYRTAINLELKWGEQYTIVIKSWRDKWERHDGVLPVHQGNPPSHLHD